MNEIEAYHDAVDNDDIKAMGEAQAAIIASVKDQDDAEEVLARLEALDTDVSDVSETIGGGAAGQPDAEMQKCWSVFIPSELRDIKTRQPLECFCCEPEVDGEKWAALYCKHTWHETCIEKWLNTSTLDNKRKPNITCPACRHIVATDVKVYSVLNPLKVASIAIRAEYKRMGILFVQYKSGALRTKLGKTNALKCCFIIKRLFERSIKRSSLETLNIYFSDQMFYRGKWCEIFYDGLACGVSLLRNKTLPENALSKFFTATKTEMEPPDADDQNTRLWMLAISFVAMRNANNASAGSESLLYSALHESIYATAVGLILEDTPSCIGVRYYNEPTTTVRGGSDDHEVLLAYMKYIYLKEGRDVELSNEDRMFVLKLLEDVKIAKQIEAENTHLIRQCSPQPEAGIDSTWTVEYQADIDDDKEEKLTGNWYAFDPNNKTTRRQLLTETEENTHGGRRSGTTDAVWACALALVALGFRVLL